MTAKPVILVAHDLREGGAAAYEAGVAMARDLGANLVLAHAFEPRVLSQADVIHVAYSHLWHMEAMVELEDAHELTEVWANRARKEGLQVTTHIGKGDPGKYILAAAKQHQVLVIVVGANTQKGLKRYLPGSTAGYVIRHSNRPVLVAPRGLGHQRRRAVRPARPQPLPDGSPTPKATGMTGARR